MLVFINEDSLAQLMRNLNHQNSGRFLKQVVENKSNFTAILHFDAYPDYLRFCTDRGITPVSPADYASPYRVWLGDRQPDFRLFRKYVRGDIS